MSSTNSFSRQLTKVVVLFVLGISFVVIYMLYLPKEERLFLRQIGEEFQNRAENVSPHERVIKIYKIFNFNWNKVCLITDDMYLNFQGNQDVVNRNLLGENYLESTINKINTNDIRFKSGLVFLFFYKPVKVLKFSKFDTFRFGGEGYNLLYLDWTKKEYFSSTKEHKALPCFSRENAILKTDNHSRKLLLGAE